jgi:hypothetical protein
MEARLKLSKTGNDKLVDATHYRSIVGGLRYLVHTSPDISYAVGYVSRFMEVHTSEHLAAVKHPLRYVAGTLSLGIVYRRGKGRPVLLGFSDADLAGDVDDRKSTTGMIFFLGRSPVSWQSQKQRVVATSSCKSEYIAAATNACQGLWLSRLVGELLSEEVRVPKLLVDNKSVISLIKNPVFHECSKHVDLCYHLIRDYVEKGELGVDYVSMVAQLADILTKALGRIRFQEQRDRISKAAKSSTTT